METGMRLGIDEAGYGPSLGPLTVGLVGVRGEGDPLGRLISRAPEGLPRIADSKKVKQGPRGLERLELTALAAYRVQRRASVCDLEELLPEGFGAQEGLPWLRDPTLALPLWNEAEAVEEAAGCLAAGLEEEGGELVVATCETSSAARFNERVLSLGNKARVEQEMIEALLDRALPQEGDCRVVVDRLGGRHHYEEWLSRVHPFCPLSIEDEGKRASRYTIQEAGRTLEYHFLVDGESHAAEVALASCLAKYQRELLMELFNRYWCGRHPELLPTAGYAVDARRFLSDIEGDAQAKRLRSRMVRMR